MVLLYRNRQLSQTRLRDLAGLTDGNLATHLQRLREVGYVEVRRLLVGVRFEVQVWITRAGAAAFQLYLKSLEQLLGSAQPTDGGDPPRPSDPS
jgi:DNA-binding MarR family transcriptional regulator